MSLLLWSGGCDSTLMLYKLLNVVGSSDKIRTISIMHPQLPANIQQQRARDKIEKFLNKSQLSFERTEISMHTNASIVSSGNLIQPPLWLSLAQVHLEATEDLYVGYIKLDDFWHYHTYATQAFDNLQYIMGKTGKLKFPLEWLERKEISNELKRIKLYDKCWWCENPKNRNTCGKCHACKHH